MTDDELKKLLDEINGKLDTIRRYVVPYEVQIREQREHSEYINWPIR